MTLVTACDPGTATLIVDLKTDWVGGVEVAMAEVVIDDGEHTDQRPLRLEDDLAGGLRVAELHDLPHGNHRVSLTLRAPNGAVVATRRALVSLRGPLAITLLVTRNCAGVTCDDPGRPECVDATCVPPECVEEDPAACEGSTCETAADCSDGAVMCVEPTCSGGFCISAPVVDSCAGGEYCDPARGCQPRPGADAGVPDAGTSDGGSDAGADGGAPTCSDPLEPNDTPDAAADAPVVTDFGPGSSHTVVDLSVCVGDEDWIAVGTLGVVRVTAVVDSTSIGGPGQICVALYSWSETARAASMAPTSAGTPLCLAPGTPLDFGPATATLDASQNYILLRVTADTDVAYDVTFRGML